MSDIPIRPYVRVKLVREITYFDLPLSDESQIWGHLQRHAAIITYDGERSEEFRTSVPDPGAEGPSLHLSASNAAEILSRVNEIEIEVLVSQARTATAEPSTSALETGKFL
jgi:hypothetical protein